MAKVHFTSWKDRAHLLEVRDEFYPPHSYKGPDMRPRACAKVAAWKLRGNIPHHVEATALLTDAILHDDGERNSIFSIRATYSAAFCRFVTGLVDTKTTGPRRTMFQRAMDLGLPASFVELRHEATHREPPSLIVLRKATQRSLEWLWDNYWTTLDPDGLSGSSSRADHSDLPTATALRQCLQGFMKNSKARLTQKKRKRDQETALADNLIGICRDSKDSVDSAMATLSVSLLELNALIDPNRSLGDSMDATFEKWDPILQRVTDARAAFLHCMAEELVNTMVLSSSADDHEIAHVEGLYLWLEHLITSTSWESRRQFLPREYLLAVCQSNPSRWTAILTAELRPLQHELLDGMRSSHTAKGPTSQKHVANWVLSKKLENYGWGLAESWDSRPLGVSVSQ
ncbi:hypothetical protein N7539_005684 [Penicillium diatomitis]|uniref:Cell morphogenesis protein Las1 n=1 Tax=Penicillium diatomitis TaxID=2819901 RepID=A0A9W9X7V2_9EURO|nr:uncharacterized protein N7539_005684 [Penicillium diatomitis]KAJ5485696.1 hypothetical protein N7539_005684 [Penicillium diatomitis]